jgi:signal transduction histidine kinase
MDSRKHLRNARFGWSPVAGIAVTTLAAIAICVCSLLCGWVIIFQNVLYVPIVIACMYYVKKGFLFSIALSLTYLLLVMVLAGDSVTILHASIRVFLFGGIAAVITFLSARRGRVKGQVRREHEGPEKQGEERTAEPKRMTPEAVQRQEELLHVLRVNTLGEMASGLAHELSQPLSAILNSAGACAQRTTSGQADMKGILRSLEKISDQAKRAGNILGRIRALAQRHPPEFTAVDVNEIVRNVVDLTSWEMKLKQVRVKLELCPKLPSIWADAVQIEQVVLNLARNAIEAMSVVEEGKRLLTIRTQTDGGGRIRVEVSDTGVGLPEGDVNRIFEPFFTTKTSGLGIGLSISRVIVETHNGTLEARRNTERGSTLVLGLPVNQPDDP